MRAEVSQIAGNLNGMPDANLTYSSASELGAGYSRLMLANPVGVGVAHYTAAELAQKLGGYVRIDGFQSGANGTAVINVDCAGAGTISMPQARVVIDGQEQGVNEVTEFYAGKVIWNFVHAEGVTIETHLMTGILLAPGATVKINQNLNGTVVADVIEVRAESHRTDFTGKIVETDEYGVTVKKIETGYAGSALSGSEFDLYQWQDGQWVRVNAQPYVTGSDGMFALNNLAEGAAYKLVETKAPEGYVLRDGPYCFWVGAALSQCPEGFSGSHVTGGDTLYIPNDQKSGDEFELPETGGEPYRLSGAGALLMMLAAGLLLRERLRRRGRDGRPA